LVAPVAPVGLDAVDRQDLTRVQAAGGEPVRRATIRPRTASDVPCGLVRGRRDLGSRSSRPPSRYRRRRRCRCPRLIPYSAAAAVTDNCDETTLRTATGASTCARLSRMSRLTSSLSGVTYVVDSDTSGRARTTKAGPLPTGSRGWRRRVIK
jgi:hypothetical protein